MREVVLSEPMAQQEGRPLRLRLAGAGHLLSLRLCAPARIAAQGRDCVRAALRPAPVSRPGHRAGAAAAAPARARRDGRADSSISRYFQNSRITWFRR